MKALAALCKSSLGDFVIEAWHVLEPNTPLLWSWHLDVLCDHVQAVLMGPVKGVIPGKLPRTGLARAWAQQVIINVPPGTMKSLIVSVFAVAWQWLRTPSWRVLCASGNPRVMTRDSLKCRDLIRSEWYQQLFKPYWKLSEDSDTKLLFKNTAGGFRSSMGAGAASIGERGDCLLVDDPNDAQAVHSKAERETINERWWDSAFGNRINNPKLSTKIIIMQRLHEEDLAGHIMSREKLTSKGGTWELLCMRMQFETDSNDSKTWLGWTDPRTVPGTPLMPHRFPDSYLDAERLRLGSAGYAGQMQQRPAPAAGNRFQKKWFRFYKPHNPPHWWRPLHPRPDGCNELPPVELPKEFDEVWEAWDMTFKDTDGTDYVCGGKWGRKGADKFLLRIFHARASFTETCKAVTAMKAAEPFAYETVVEDKANGSAVMNVLGSAISGLVPFEPMGSKEARAASIEPQVEAGNVYLPDGADWVEAYIGEMCAFPNAANDDRVDMTSMALIRVTADADVESARALCGL